MALFNGTLLHLLLPHKTYEEYTALAATAAQHCLHSWQKRGVRIISRRGKRIVVRMVAKNNISSLFHVSAAVRLANGQAETLLQADYRCRSHPLIVYNKKRGILASSGYCKSCLANVPKAKPFSFFFLFQQLRRQR